MGGFHLIQKDSQSQGRTGLLKTDHGEIETPAFMPVGTGGAVKGITPEQLKETGAGVILANTYH
ncbi:MAG: tRNA-guanine transglycosylase, partial [Sedimentisphaerales bacterium]|nr:tRNA-guanine transglycosylase [Sedimentisphaerales bacterium]